jgi:biopolymer transport protein ExbD
MRYFEVQKPRIEIIPMIDIMLFLLVFFIMIALKMIPTSGLIGHLPATATSENLPKTKVMIEIHQDGSLMVDQQTMTLSALKAKLRELSDGKTVVTIAGAATVSMQQLADVMDACRQSGVTQIGMATRHAN